MSARTENDVFRDFLGAGHTDDGLRFREWWRRYWMDHLSEYFDLKWKLVPCGKYSKRPLAGFKWSERSLAYEEAVWYAAQGMNLAVVAGPSNLIVLDYDSEAVKPFDTLTLTMRTPKGYQFYTCPPYDESLGARLKKRGFDTPRAGMMFALIPLSRTCVNDRGGSCGCLVHDFRYREWVNFGADPLPFRKVAKVLLN